MYGLTPCQRNFRHRCTDHGTQAYDSHCNLVLGEVEETIYTIEEDEDGEETVKVSTARQGVCVQQRAMLTDS